MYENRREVKYVNCSVKRKVNNNYRNMTGTINPGVVDMVAVLVMSLADAEHQRESARRT